MRRQLRWYGASPLHLLAMLACFGLAGYAAARLIPSAPLGVAVWFLGAVIGHDLVLMPLYSLADRSAIMAIRHREPQLPAGPWINYLRVPAALSGLLLLVWFPLILRLPSPYHASTTLSADPYVWHWLGVTGALFLLSAVALAFRLRRSSRSVPTSKGPGAAADATDPDHKGGPEAPNDESGPETDSGQVAGEPDREPEAPEGSQDADEPAPAEAAYGDEERESSAAAEAPDATSPGLEQHAGPQDSVRPEVDSK
jgi:hypothetical protein